MYGWAYPPSGMSFVQLCYLLERIVGNFDALLGQDMGSGLTRPRGELGKFPIFYFPLKYRGDVWHIGEGVNAFHSISLRMIC